MGLTIPENILDAADITAEELLIEIAVHLYDTERLSFGQAKNLAQMDHLAFQQEIAKRDVYIKYDEDDLATDLHNLDPFNQAQEE